jgi:hypothetical protein
VIAPGLCLVDSDLDLFSCFFGFVGNLFVGGFVGLFFGIFFGDGRVGRPVDGIGARAGLVGVGLRLVVSGRRRL